MKTKRQFASAKERQQFGRDMVWAGQWAEYHQKREKWEMYYYWNDIYQRMMREYHNTE